MEENRKIEIVEKKGWKVNPDEKIVNALLEKYWNKTLRELSCNSMVNVMNCFVLL